MDLERYVRASKEPEREDGIRGVLHLRDTRWCCRSWETMLCSEAVRSANSSSRKRYCSFEEEFPVKYDSSMSMSMYN